MADLTNRSVASSYKELLKTTSSSGVTAALTSVEDGDATLSALQLSSAGIKSSGFLVVDGATTLNTVAASGLISGQSLSLAGTLTVNGSSNLQGNLGVGGSVTVTNNLTVQGTLFTSGGALATQQGTEVFTNKTINLTQNTLQATSAQMLAAVSDETGTGLLVFNNTPTLTTPVINNGSLNMASGTVVFPTAATPAQTAEGSVVWDSNDDLLTVGTGAGRKTMVDTDSTQTLSNKTMVISPTITLGTHLTGSLTLTNLAGGTLSASLVPNSAVQRIEASKNSSASAVGTGRKRLNFIEGSNVLLTLADDSVNDRLNLTISVPNAGGGGGGSATDVRDIWLLS